MNKKIKFIQRCIDLGKLGAGFVSPNPMVGAVIAYNNQIIGEGYHKLYGKEHAEVNAANDVKEDDKSFLKMSTMYVSLEPCCIQGRTPPCTNIVIDLQIPKIVVSIVDKTEAVSGKSIKLLQKQNVKVRVGTLKERAFHLSKYRNHFVLNQRPYVIIKFAQSADGFIGKKQKGVWLTNNFSKRLVHKWRAEVDAIMVGTNTAQTDNPKLTTRYRMGRSPIRVVLDKHLRLKQNLHIFDDSVQTIIFTSRRTNRKSSHTRFITLTDWSLENILKELGKRNITSLLVEGGKQLIDSFVSENLWEEARIFKTTKILNSGIPAPSIQRKETKTFKIHTDTLEVFHNPNQSS